MLLPITTPSPLKLIAFLFSMYFIKKQNTIYTPYKYTLFSQHQDILQNYDTMNRARLFQLHDLLAQMTNIIDDMINDSHGHPSPPGSPIQAFSYSAFDENAANQNATPISLSPLVISDHGEPWQYPDSDSDTITHVSNSLPSDDENGDDYPFSMHLRPIIDMPDTQVLVSSDTDSQRDIITISDDDEKHAEFKSPPPTPNARHVFEGTRSNPILLDRAMMSDDSYHHVTFPDEDEISQTYHIFSHEESDALRVAIQPLGDSDTDDDHNDTDSDFPPPLSP